MLGKWKVDFFCCYNQLLTLDLDFYEESHTLWCLNWNSAGEQVYGSGQAACTWAKLYNSSNISKASSESNAEGRPMARLGERRGWSPLPQVRFQPGPLPALSPTVSLGFASQPTRAQDADPSEWWVASMWQQKFLLIQTKQGQSSCSQHSGACWHLGATGSSPHVPSWLMPPSAQPSLVGLWSRVNHTQHWSLWFCSHCFGVRQTSKFWYRRPRYCF